jgi:Sulfotransferase family
MPLKPRTTRSVGMRDQLPRSLLTRAVGRLRESKDPEAPRLGAPRQHEPDSRDSAPEIFVAGCQRSGTSLLRRILDTHSNIACPPESYFIVPLIRVLNDERSLRGLAGMGYDREAFRLTLARLVQSFFEQYAAAHGKGRWADKTPQYVDCLPQLHELFPAARFVFMIRHGMDVACSLADAHRHYPAIDHYVQRAGGSVAIGAARFWAEQNEKVIRFQESCPESCFVIRYESLTTQPEQALQPLFAFLGEAWEPQVINYTSREHHSGIEDPDVKRRRSIEPNSGRYRTWPQHLQESVERACEPTLSRLGYSAG